MLVLSFFLLSSNSGEFTNGVFYVDNFVNGVTVSVSGETTNKLQMGHTYEVGNNLVELTTSEQTTFFFSGGPLISAGVDSKFTISLFDQEVENLNATPRKAVFGRHLLSLALVRGEFSIVYPNIDTNSVININTYYSDYELTGGKYYFRITGKSALVYVLDGGMTVHGEKSKSNAANKGDLALAIPFSDSDSGLDDKFIRSFKKAGQDEMDRFASPVLLVEKKSSDIGFFVIDGKIIGISLK